MTCSCGVCGQSFSKYKCPNCNIPYCSLPCWKSHQTQNCESTEKKCKNENENVSRKVYEFETNDTVPPEKLELLENDPELRQILENPHVRDILTSIDSATDPASAIHSAMLEPIFVEFADQCLKLIEPAPEED